MLEEYFSSGDVGEVAYSLAEQVRPAGWVLNFYMSDLVCTREVKDAPCTSVRLTALSQLELDCNPTELNQLPGQRIHGDWDLDTSWVRQWEACCTQDEPELEHVFVKKVVTLAMDRHDREREMASVLLSSLYGEVPFSAPTPLLAHSPCSFHT